MNITKKKLKKIIKEELHETYASSHDEKAQAAAAGEFAGNTIMDLESLHDQLYSRFTDDENKILDQAIALLNREAGN